MTRVYPPACLTSKAWRLATLRPPASSRHACWSCPRPCPHELACGRHQPTGHHNIMGRYDLSLIDYLILYCRWPLGVSESLQSFWSMLINLRSRLRRVPNQVCICLYMPACTCVSHPSCTIPGTFATFVSEPSQKAFISSYFLKWCMWVLL